MNPNIALSFQRPRFDSTEGQRNALAIRNAQMQEAAGAMQMQQAMAAAQRDAQTRNALSGVDMSTREGLQQAAGVYGKAGDTDMALKLNEALSKMDEQKRARTLNEMEVFKNAAPGLLSPETYMDTRAMLVESAPSAANWLPEQFDEAIVPRIEGLALGVQGIVDRDYKERQAARDAVGKTTPYPEDVAAQRRQEKAAGASRVQVMPGEKKAQELDAEYYSKLYQGLQQTARQSEKQAADYRLIDSLIGDAYSGAAGQAVTALKKYAKGLGLDLGDVSGPEAANAIANRLSLDLRNPEGGAGMPGAMSDKDREFLVGMVPGLTMTKEGRQIMGEVQKRIAKRNSEIAKFAREYRLKNKYLDINFEQALADKFSDQDLFGDLFGKVPEVPAGPMDEAGGGLTPEEQAELEALRKRFGR